MSDPTSVSRANAGEPRHSPAGRRSAPLKPVAPARDRRAGTSFLSLLADLGIFAAIASAQVAAPTMAPMLAWHGLPPHTTKPFNAVSSSMAPTLQPGDDFWADLAPGYVPRPGDIVVFTLARTPDVDYVKRIVAGPGDRIALHDGSPILNGVPVPATFDRVVTLRQDGATLQARRYIETLPGREPHAILRLTGVATGQDMPERTVPAGEVFVLGDNRDNSLDSRFPQFGLIPLAQVEGPAWIIYWSGDASRILHHIR